MLHAACAAYKNLLEKIKKKKNKKKYSKKKHEKMSKTAA